jgi:hypothetical protein
MRKLKADIDGVFDASAATFENVDPATGEAWAEML